MEMVPWGLVLFGGTMASFVGLRKIGKAHLLMPHQRSIGIGVGWTMLTSVVASLGLVDAGSPSNGNHLWSVLLPQQVMFVASLGLRREVELMELGVAFGGLVGLMAILMLRAFSKDVETDALVCLVSASLIISSVIPQINVRIKAMFILWGLLALSTVLLQSDIPPVLILLVIEQLTLLNVKIQYLDTDASKIDDKKPKKWSW